jgi:K+-sensing histidine kinase KdpD
MPEMRSALTRYGFAIAATAAAVLLRYSLDPLLVERAPHIFAISAVFVAAVFAGLGPGLLVTVLGAVAGSYLFVLPRYTFAIADADAMVSLVINSGGEASA